MEERPAWTTLPRSRELELPRPRRKPRLVWTDDDGEHSLDLDRISTLGSAPSAAVVISAATVSRLHAELEPADDGLWVRDLGSRNGTFVQGVRTMRARIPDEGVVKVGDVRIEVSYGPHCVASDVWPSDHFGPLYGASVVMREIFAKIAKMARTSSSVLIYGETGTGKEVVARALHEHSSRAAHPFVVVDCAALAETLLQSELFGHVKGAFTGALADHVGAFEAAHGGTVFLDEIGELSLAMQPKLLRVLETHVVQRVGENRPRSVDVRVLAATHRDLARMVNDGAFREDLYFRLAVLPITLPPLRARRGDIPALLESFLPPEVWQTLDPSVVRQLVERPWLGNVRELRNVAERIAALGPEEALRSDSPSTRAPGARLAVGTSQDAPVIVPYAGTYRDFRERWMEWGDREYLARLLARHDNNVAQAADEAGLDRTYLYRLMRKRGI